MYENYSSISLPSKEYRELIGSAICIFNSNNSFIIENMLYNENIKKSWHYFIDQTSGSLKRYINDIFKNRKDIVVLFTEIIEQRNRIVHSFMITNSKKEMGDDQILSTKYKDGKQKIIDEAFLLDFIEKNNKLSSMLYAFRDQNRRLGPLS